MVPSPAFKGQKFPQGEEGAGKGRADCKAILFLVFLQMPGILAERMRKQCTFTQFLQQSGLSPANHSLLGDEKLHGTLKNKTKK